MKLQFKHQKFQKDAARAVVDVFSGQPYLTSIYMIDSGVGRQTLLDDFTGWRNEPIIPELTDSKILENINMIQKENNIKVSEKLEGRYNLTVEMETGVGKTYTYIKTMYELNKKYGWSKFIVVVPSVAIREGVHKSFEITQDHFAEEYRNIEQVYYVEDLNPFIERKLFTVNTGHAALSYIAYYLGIELVSDGAKHADVRKDFIAVLEETSALLEKKWGFDKTEMEAYRNKTIKRFENPRIVDNVSRICRTPIRKLGYNERFIKPIREAEELGLSNSALLKACSYILTFKSEEDEQSVKLEQLIKEKGVIEALSEVTELTDTALLNKIKEGYEKLV